MSQMSRCRPGFGRDLAVRPSRRGVLMSASAIGLSWLLARDREAVAVEPGRKKSLVTIWLAGGPSQLETFDPHPGTPIGGPTRSIETAIPGVRIADTLPRLAEVLDRFSLVRSLVSKEGDHERGTHAIKTGYRPDPTLVHPSVGAIVANELPVEGLEIPSYIALGTGGFPSRAGYLGAALDPYRVQVPGLSGQNLTPQVSAARQDRRLAAVASLGQGFLRGRSVPLERSANDAVVSRALAMMNSRQLAAFSVGEEPQAMREAYGDTPFGRGCLVARRLLETGVRSIEVTLPGFDTHADNFTGQRAACEPLDIAVSAFVRDLDERGLLADTAIVVVGEFGRTPAINPLDGRDHWPHGFSCLLGGGGLSRGVVIGATDPEGRARQPESPFEIADLWATLLEVLGIDFERELITPIGRPMRLSAGRPDPRLLAEKA
ncbi:MAG: DUF1501 domain-containing protein [Planctomycetaceae bacterium]